MESVLPHRERISSFSLFFPSTFNQIPDYVLFETLHVKGSTFQFLWY